jgi:uncharacterized SAM-binding protein YcdF (DUF218 family)
VELIVILGAAVRPDGRPSPTLERRIGYGAQAAAALAHAPVFCSGAQGAVGPSEASVIADGLRRHDVAAHRIVLDEESRDTLQTVVAACRFLRRNGLRRAIVCTDAYHGPRTRMLFAMLGVPAVSAPSPRRPEGAAWSWRRMQLRECAAYPYDLAVAAWRRRELRAIIEAGD